MPAQGESFLVYVAFWSGDPTGVSTNAFNPPQGAIVFDLAGGPPRINTSADNSSFALISLQGGAFTPSSISSTGAIVSTSPTAGVGYAAGAGGAVTQITSNATPVTLNKITGQITTVALSLAAGASAVFTVNNAECAATDVPVVSSVYAGAGTLVCSTKNVTAGTFDITLQNVHASAALNALAVVNFAVIKGSAA